MLAEVPLVSIVCDSFNHAPYIKKCIEGFIIQKTSFLYEVLIHDDASTDGSAEIIRQYESRYPKIIKAIYQHENQYAKGIRIWPNYQFPRVKGKFIALCEGDDYWTDPLKLQKQVDFLEKNPEFSMCFHNSLVVYENSRKKPHLFTSIDKKEYDIQDIIQKNWFISTQSIVFRTELYDKCEWVNYVAGGDIALQYILATKGKIGAINEVMAVYRKHNAGLTAKFKDGLNALKITEALSFFNYYTNFKYNSMIQNKILKIRENLYLHCLSELPLSIKIINPDFLKIKLKNLQLKITKYYFYITRENSIHNK